jgi:hypothetical protein
LTGAEIRRQRQGDRQFGQTARHGLLSHAISLPAGQSSGRRSSGRRSSGRRSSGWYAVAHSSAIRRGRRPTLIDIGHERVRDLGHRNTRSKEREMADLTAKKREKLPAKEFGLPEKARTKDAKKESGNYPMPDKAHARNAKSRAAQQQEAGNLTKKERERIDRKADKILDD